MGPLSNEQLLSYLQRIEFPLAESGNLPEASLTTLQGVHVGQALNVIFENLSLHHPKARAQFPEISTDLQAVYRKIVLGRRGGYCHEVNSLLLAALQTLGFRASASAGRFCGGINVTGVYPGDPLPGHDFSIKEKNHFICLVNLDGELWLADAAGHHGTIQPIRMQFLERGITEEVTHGVHSRRVRRGIFGMARTPGIEEWAPKNGPYGYYLQALYGDSWEDIYFFTGADFFPADFAVMNFYASHSPQSYFVNNLAVSRPYFDGRATLTGNKLKVRRGDEQTDAELSDAELDSALTQHFGIVFDEN